MTLNDSFALSLPIMADGSTPPAKQVSISTLNPVCLDTVFTNFSQAELLRFRGVCRHWKDCIDAIFARTHVIKLFVNNLEFKRFNVAMRVRYFDVGQYYLFKSKPKGTFVLRQDVDAETVVNLLPKLFPNIRRLMFQRCSDIYLNGIAKLIRHCPQLIEISLAYMPENACIDSHLWSTLNSAEQLKSIMFHNMYKTVIPNELTLLKRIECFHIAHYRCSLVPILSELGPNCWRIFLTWVYLTSEELECVLSRNPTLADCVRSLRLEYIASYENRESNYKRLIECFVTYFKNIQHLDICFGDHIPRLDQLNRDIRPLLSLKSLVLESYKLTGEELLFWISFMFPNLEQLNIHSEPPDWHVDAEAIKDSFFVSLSKLRHFNLKVG